MIKGMTGYGSAKLSSKDVKAIIEIKSLNHRYFDISYYIPIGFGALEGRIRNHCQKYLQRGRITVSVKISEKPEQTIVLNKSVVKAHLHYTKQLKKEFGLKNDLTLPDLIKLPGVLEAKETAISLDAIWPALEKGLKTALISLDNMRKREGRSLAADIRDKVQRMSLQIKRIQARSKSILAEKKRKLDIDEFQSFRKGSDVNEEVSRLKHYIVEIRVLLRSNVSVGKKIDFIAQEMQRETNTIGSKLQDRVVSNAVITLKSKVEKIREQAQNIE